MRTLFILATLVGMAMSVAPCEAPAQLTAASAGWNSYTDDVSAQIYAFAAESGLSWTHGPFYDWLNQDGLEYVTVDLTAGVPYVFFGACDSDCSDLDFTLIDDNGNVVAEDVTSDAVPMVRVTPAWSATFRLKVKMYSCSVSPCYWGVGVFQ